MYWECATLGSPDHPPLVFLHGFLGSAASWLDIARAFAADHHCLLFDLPGCGQGASIERPIDAVMDIPSVADELAAIVNELGPAPIRLLGYSMGARIALAFALAHPEQVEALVLESGNPGLAEEAERAARADRDRLLAQKIRREGIAQFVDEWYDTQPVFASLRRNPELLARHKLQCMRRNNPQWTAKVLEELSPGLMPDYRPQLSAFSAPTLLIAGALDTKYCGIGGQMAESLADARFTAVADAGHAVHLEQPIGFIREVSGFFSALGRPEMQKAGSGSAPC